MFIIDWGVNRSGACNALFIIMAYNACWLTNRALAHTPTGTGVKVTLGIVWGVRCLMEWRCFGGALGLDEMSAGTFRGMVGTPPCALFCVCLWWTHFVVLNCRFAMGSRDCMMAGAYEILVISTANIVTGAGGWLASLSTLCSSQSVRWRMSSIALCNYWINSLPLLVLTTFVTVSLKFFGKCFQMGFIAEVRDLAMLGKKFRRSQDSICLHFRYVV